jgi:hypothetical protein
MGVAPAAQHVLLGSGRVIGQHILQTPTIVAWDFGALCRILPIEARSP